MPENLPGPYEIEFEVIGYVAPVRTHKIRMNVVAVGSPAPGTLPTAITIQKRGGGTATLAVVANQAWEFLRVFYQNTINCPSYQFWKYQTGTRTKDFIATGALTNPAGTSASATTLAHEIVMSFRSANGGIMKTVLLETINTGNAQTALVPNAAGNIAQRWAAYVLSADGISFAADDAFPIAALRVSDSENEKVWKKIYRGA